MLTAVVTTINPPTKPIQILSDKVRSFGGNLIIIGDEKTPVNYNVDGFVPLSIQGDFDLSLASLLPKNSYTRKNIGYLMAFEGGATVVYDTDDDTYPSDKWEPISFTSENTYKIGSERWVNIYNWFSGDDIWPRGLPLQYARERVTSNGLPFGVQSPIHQCLVNKSPDVDSVLRMLYYNQEFRFRNRESVVTNSWAPTNSQNTWWFLEAFPLMYLPSTCTFRATDIWRGLIAQRILVYTLGYDIVFHQADAIQERNPHNLLHDFELEVPVFLYTEKLTEIIDSVDMGTDIYENLLLCYQALVDEGIFKPEELPLVKAWINDCKNLL